MDKSIKISLTGIIVALIITVSILGSTYLASSSYLKSKIPNGKITVTGSAKKQIKSDFAVWKGIFSVQAKTLSEAYSIIKNDQVLVNKYFSGKGISSSDMSTSSISTTINYSKTPNGILTSNIESYRLSQTIEIRTNDVDKIVAISKESTELINEGVEFESMAPQYFYTKIADLKVDMLALATKDATARADQIASNSGAKVLGLQTAKMGVFQITPLYSNQLTDSGVNDTSSIDKEIMAVMNCDFKIK